MREKKQTTLWEVIMDNAKSTSNEFADKLRHSVTEYLTSEGWRVGAPRSFEGVQWELQANDDLGRPITVFQEATLLKTAERIGIATALKLSPEHQERYAELSLEEKRDLIYDLRQQVILLGVGYAGLKDPLERMIFEDVIYIDELSKGSFLKSVRKVRSAGLLAGTIIARRFNEPPPPEPPRPALGFHVADK